MYLLANFLCNIIFVYNGNYYIIYVMETILENEENLKMTILVWYTSYGLENIL